MYFKIYPSHFVFACYVQISAQVIPDPGNDLLSDSLPPIESTAAHYGKTTVFKNGIINKATQHNNFF